MEYPGLVPETVLTLFRALLYSMACVLAGATIIALSVYGVLVCSEIFFSEPHSRIRAKASQSTRLIPFAAEIPVLSAAERPILAAPEPLATEGIRVHDAQIPLAVPNTLESEST